MAAVLLATFVLAAGGCLAQSSRTLYVALGEHGRVDRRESWWPSGLEQEMSGLEIDRLHHLAKPEKGAEKR